MPRSTWQLSTFAKIRIWQRPSLVLSCFCSFGLFLSKIFLNFPEPSEITLSLTHATLHRQFKHRRVDLVLGWFAYSRSYFMDGGARQTRVEFDQMNALRVHETCSWWIKDIKGMGICRTWRALKLHSQGEMHYCLRKNWKKSISWNHAICWKQCFMHFSMFGKRMTLQSPALILYRSRTRILNEKNVPETCLMGLGGWIQNRMMRHHPTSSDVCVEATLINSTKSSSLSKTSSNVLQQGDITNMHGINMNKHAGFTKVVWIARFMDSPYFGRDVSAIWQFDRKIGLPGATAANGWPANLSGENSLQSKHLAMDNSPIAESSIKIHALGRR